MNDTNPPVQSLKSLIIASAVATVIAGFVLIIFVLPAEYDIDPTGLGKKMGLTVLAASTAESNQAQAIAIPIQPQPVTALTCPDQKNEIILAQTTATIAKSEPEPAAKAEIKAKKETENSPQNIAAVQAPQWQDTVKIIIPPKQGLEYKFHLQKGASLEYAWASDGTKLYFDFHGEPKGDKTGYFKSFKESTDRQSSGALIAPFEGSHGWYWENSTRAPVTVILNTKGSYRILGLM